MDLGESYSIGKNFFYPIARNCSTIYLNLSFLVLEIVTSKRLIFKLKNVGRLLKGMGLNLSIGAILTASLSNLSSFVSICCKEFGQF